MINTKLKKNFGQPGRNDFGKKGQQTTPTQMQSGRGEFCLYIGL